MLGYFLIYVAGFLLSGIWIASRIFIYSFLTKRKLDVPGYFDTCFAALIPATIICLYFNANPFAVSGIANIRLWCIAIVTVLLVSCIVLAGKKLLSGSKNKENSSSTDSRKPLFSNILDGAFMEIPQRLMMQTFICGLLNKFGMNIYSGILINAVVWCSGIIFQAVVMNKEKNAMKLIPELIASFIFSIGVGYVFLESSCIFMTMISHAAQRIVTTLGSYHIRSNRS